MPRGEDILHRRNKRVDEVLPSYPENTEILDQYLQDESDDTVEVPEIIRKSLKRKHEPEIFDEIIVEEEPWV